MLPSTVLCSNSVMIVCILDYFNIIRPVPKVKKNDLKDSNQRKVKYLSSLL